MKVTNKEALEQLGLRLKAKFDVYESERRQLEQQWLKNLRQYKGIYDPEIEFPKGKSKVYPKDTHTKIVGWVAKMMEMMFPAQDRNWSLGVSPFPNIAAADLQTIITTLQTQASTPDPNTGELSEISSADIEKAVKEFASERATRMEKECDDQLSDPGIDYPELCKKTIRRGGIYGFGVVEGPNVKTQTERTWEPGEDGQFVAVSTDVKRPVYETLKAWDTYPDLSAKTWGTQEGLFTRKVFARHGLRALARRDDFFEDVIDDYLKDNDRGNYKARSFEAELNEIKKTEQTAPDMSRQYEVFRWYGYIPAQMLKDVGVNVPESALNKEILSDVWLLDGMPIKADMAPFGEKVDDMFHIYLPEEDEDGPLTGTAKVEILRDSQLKLCAIDRATMDNMAESASSIKEVNDDLISPANRVGAIHGGMMIHRTGEGNEANYPAVRVYEIPNHTPSLLDLRKSVLEVFDVESNLPSWRMGNAQPLGEAFRTSSNMSMMAGGGDMVTKDDVRAFDRFVKSLVESLVMWNMEFNKKTDIKSDYQVMPKDSISLVAKEVRGAALDQLSMTLTDRERAMIEERELLIDRFKSRDLPVEYVKDADACRQALAQMDQAQSDAAARAAAEQEAKTGKLGAEAQKASAQAQEILASQNAKINALVAKASAELSKGKGIDDGNQRESLKLLLEQIGSATQQGGATDSGAATAQ